MQIWVPSNPRGAERLPPAILASESDLFPRRLFGKPSEVCLSLTQSSVIFLDIMNLVMKGKLLCLNIVD